MTTTATPLLKDLLLMAKEERVRADEEYRQAVLMAKDEGWTNTEIARAVGMTEAAIRMYIKRHKVHIRSSAYYNGLNRT